MTALGHIFAFLMITAASVLVSFLGAVVLLDMWGWFIVPLGGVPVGFWHAMGLLTFLSLMQLGLYQAKRDNVASDDPWFMGSVFKTVLYTCGYLVIWGLGAIWHHLMITAH